MSKAYGDFKLCVAAANAFWDAACFCQHKNIDMISPYLIAFSTNLAFSAELYLKAISIYLSPQNEFEKGHDLQKLFDCLPSEVQNEIKDAYNREFHIHDFVTILEQHKDAFNDWRYGFAGNGSLSIQSTDFGTLVRCLKNYCKTLVG